MNLRNLTAQSMRMRMRWCAALLVVACSHAALIESQTVPMLRRYEKGNANQSWTISGASAKIMLHNGPLCLAPLTQRLDARNNVTNPVLMLCSSPQAAAWTVESSEGMMTLRAGSKCLGLVYTVWPIPISRNYLLQLTDCGTKPPQWSYNATAKRLVNPEDGSCLDGTSVDPLTSVPRTCDSALVKAFPFCDTALGFADRAADLVSRLSIDEMAGLLSMSMPRTETSAGTVKLNQRLTTPIASLGIPAFEFSEACHGILAGCLRGSEDSTRCPTSFPEPIGQAASFNAELWHSVAAAIGLEGRALMNGGLHGPNVFAPNINLWRDPRWGRGYETPGEDALLTARFAVQYVTGLQGTSNYLQHAATCKHSLLYDLETNRSASSSHALARDLTEYFLVPFEFCIKKAKVASIMCQYGADDGTPSCANSAVNDGLYRDTYGFEGFIISDCDAVTDFSKFPKINASTAAQATADGINGGLDVDCGMSYANIPTAVGAGLVSDASIRAAAHRFLTKQLALGMLEHTPFDAIGPEVVDSADHRALALQAATQSIVLLRNEAATGSSSSILPLTRGAKIAFIGRHADSTVDLLGNYQGVNLQVLNRSVVDIARLQQLDFSFSDGEDQDAAVAMSRAAEVTVLLLGLSEADEGEGHDRVSLTLPPQQLALAAAVASVQPNTVLVLVTGGAIAVESLISGVDAVPAVLQAFYPGQMGAAAILSVLFGESNPSGRLPYSVYPAGFMRRSPTNFDLQGDGGLTYKYYNGKYGDVLYPFGFGLSYTSFAFSFVEPERVIDVADLKRGNVSGTCCYDCSKMEFAVRVTNTGTAVGDAVVLGFVSSKQSNATKEMFDFGRIANILPGASAVISLAMDGGCKQSVSLVHPDGRRWVTPGEYVLEVGDVLHPTSVKLQVTGQAVWIDPSCAIM